ncbi:plasma-membrane calcium-translocating P-type ATPase [Ectothiorhodospira magna]|uniref:P-type Ca(2+) transporter n=1 Tax=Ectothiorhodospira magna TaxID=867345 RepID=A0A1H9EW52_9GAMM|nr:calcium-translocating P-type ATPase, PMCA-type [Ectothiorhodospira magna]SEQ29473.1 plasma-membrane calcium-translocating P-type ATPase [Ectothiorhodospira magna]
MKVNFKGLTDDEIQASKLKFGDNSITQQEGDTFLSKLMDNLKDPTILVLVAALVMISVLAIFGHAEWYEGVGIFLAVVIATGVATFSEHKNESAFQRLLEEASRVKIRAYRNGESRYVALDDLVVGDLVILAPGDKVPADGVIIQGDLMVDQASLTGEADHIHKVSLADPEQIPDASALTPQHPSSVLRGSVVVDGEAVVHLLSVGDRSMYGQLAQDMQSADRDSPLKAKLGVLAENIGKFGLIAAILVALAFLFMKLFMERGLTLTTLMPYFLDSANWGALLGDIITAVILAAIILVVAVPEGLPMMIAIVLALNMKKLLSGNVLVRKLMGIEAAGSMNILFTDKTGTLTRGILQVSTVVRGDGDKKEDYASLPPALGNILVDALKHNTTAVLESDAAGRVRVVGGDRTEKALLAFIDPALRESVEGFPIVDFIPFNSERKFSAVQVEGRPGAPVLVKGAPELIIDRCRYYYDAEGKPVDIGHGEAVRATMDALARQSMRLLAIATAATPLAEDRSMPEEMTLVAIIGLRDELRPESRESVESAQNAGIQVVMVTGDRRETAEAIGRDVGLIHSDGDLILSADELERMSDEEVKAVLPTLRIVARAFPHQKARLVRLAQELGMVVGMTGDGVNDASALKRADVGFAMGSGTELAKDAGDIVIMDDNFSSLTRSVLYGRTLFRSIRKFLVFQLTVNLSAILLMFLGPLFGFELPLTMIQLLWINLIMDTLAALAFSGEAAMRRYMDARPIERTAPLISSDMWSSILVNGVIIAILSILFLTSAFVEGLFRNEAVFLTAFFAFFVFIHNFNKFNARTERLNILENILQNRGFLGIVGLIFLVQILFTYLGGDILRTVGLTFQEWLYVVLFSLVIIPIDMARKLIRDKVTGATPA